LSFAKVLAHICLLLQHGLRRSLHPLQRLLLGRLFQGLAAAGLDRCIITLEVLARGGVPLQIGGTRDYLRV